MCRLPARRHAERITIFIMPADIDFKYHTCSTFLHVLIHTWELDHPWVSRPNGDVFEIECTDG